ncbi:Transferrin [Eumeta japonica]|uniref:Transferrin n=1 Tax=Eumeta variegata TaxID=151549 RepID=A0A4C1Z442_EUMVA|nr:Transferrin [Eumeta japonica]
MVIDPKMNFNRPYISSLRTNTTSNHEWTILVVTEQFAFEAVAVVPNSHRNGRDGLQNGGYCHPGLDQTEQRWSPRVLKTLEREVARTDRCAEPDTRDKTFEELETETLSKYFGAACRPGRWSLDDAVDARLKRDYPNLCTLCSGNGTSDCSGGYRYNMMNIDGASSTNRHIQALECLTKYNGTVAYVAWRHVNEYFLQRQSDLISNYSLLCPNNTLVALTRDILSNSLSPCAWVQQPWSAVVASTDQAAALLGEMKTWWPNGINPNTAESWQISVFDTFLGGVNTLLVYEDNMPNAVTYVSSGRTLPSIDSTSFCMQTQRWCITSEQEQLKCDWVRNALYTLGVEPALSCQLRQSPLHCLRDIRENNADFIAIDSNYGYLGRQTYNLSPVMLLENQHAMLSRVAALVRNTSDITRFENLRDRKACFPEFGGIVKLATKPSQWRKIGTQRIKNKLGALYLRIASSACISERQSSVRCAENACLQRRAADDPPLTSKSALPL